MLINFVLKMQQSMQFFILSLLFYYQILEMNKNSSACNKGTFKVLANDFSSHGKAMPFKVSMEDQNQMRIRTQPNEMLLHNYDSSPNAKTFHFANPSSRMSSNKSANKGQKLTNHNEIQYFELDLKNMINGDKPAKQKYISKDKYTNPKESMFSLLEAFIYKLEDIGEDQIESFFPDQLNAHFQKKGQKDSPSLTALMNLSINELKNKINSTSVTFASKTCESKRQKTFIDHKYQRHHKYKQPKQSQKQLQHLNPLNLSIKTQSLNNFQVKKVVKTMTDKEGNEYRVTVEKLK